MSEAVTRISPWPGVRPGAAHGAVRIDAGCGPEGLLCSQDARLSPSLFLALGHVGTE